MTTLEEAKAFLKQECVDGTNLYDHLSDVLLKILVERPENLHDTFESISAAVKLQRYVAPPQSAAVSESADTTNAKREIVRCCPGEGYSLLALQSHRSRTLVVQLAQTEKWCNQALDLLKVLALLPPPLCCHPRHI